MINSVIGNHLGPFGFSRKAGIPTISLADNTDADATKASNLAITAANKTDGTGNAGDLILTGGEATSTGVGGAILIKGGASSSDVGGTVTVQAGTSNRTGAGSSLTVLSGTNQGSGIGGTLTIQGGGTSGGGDAGTTIVRGGRTIAGGIAGPVQLRTGNSAGGIVALQVSSSGDNHVYLSSNGNATSLYWTVDANGDIGAAAASRPNHIYAAGNVMASGHLGVGNTAAATTLGTVVKKMEVFDASGNSLGFIPVYNSIS